LCEDGAATVDWVVLTGATLLLALGLTSLFLTDLGDRIDVMESDMAEQRTNGLGS
jgi:hypothetical protein